MERKLGAYIHIPFCASKCAYCDFYSLSGCDRFLPRYHSAVIEHIRQSSQQMQDYFIDTVYFGGGTPSYYGARRLGEIFNALKRYALVYKTAEVTVECNPDSVTRRALNVMREDGVNRLSIGAQSANEDLLKILGRRHSWVEVERTVKTARKAGFENISLDLIYGIPSQSRADWAETLSRAVELNPDHISCYGLKLEEETPLYSYRDSPLLPDDDEQADMYLYMVETLERFGYKQYEISNFARPGFQSKHNLKYWQMRDYIGFGPGAHSFVGGIRYSYIKSIGRYIKGIQNEDNILDEYEPIAPIGRAAEYIMLGLRTTRGISEREYRSLYRSDFAPLEEQFREYEYKGWARFENDRWRLTPPGFLLSNLLIGTLLDRQSEHKVSGNPWMDADDVIPDRGELPAGDEIFYRSRK